MILKTKIATSYYFIFSVVIPAILISFHLIYRQIIPLGPGMIIMVFSLPFLLLPFVFEYYTIDVNHLRVKNILGITTKKIGISDYEDIYALDKTTGRYKLSSSSIYIVDKQERIIELRSYYCPNIADFIDVLSRGKTLREDRAQLHCLRREVKEYIIYVILISAITLAFIYGLVFNSNSDFKWWFIVFFGFMFWLVYQLAKELRLTYKNYTFVKKAVDDKTMRLSKMDKRFKMRNSFF